MIYYSGHETIWWNGVAMTLKKDIAKCMQKMLNTTLRMNIVLFFMIERQKLKKQEQGIIGRFRLGECNNEEIG